MSKKILVIDDERVMARMITGILNRNGYEAQTVASVYDALTNFPDLPFDLVTCDMLLPDISGLDFLELMYTRKGCPQRPVLLVTAMSQADLLDKATKLGAIGILQKPFTVSQLLDEISRTFEKIGAGN